MSQEALEYGDRKMLTRRAFGGLRRIIRHILIALDGRRLQEALLLAVGLGKMLGNQSLELTLFLYK